MNKVRPMPRRCGPALRGVDAFVVESLAVAALFAVVAFVVIAFGRRRLGCELEPGLSVLAEVLGRVVRNAPRTSSSCCAEDCREPKPASAIKRLKNINFVLMKTSPSTKIQTSSMGP